VLTIIAMLIWISALSIGAVRAESAAINPVPSVELPMRLVSDEVSMGPGAVAWSPDGQRLAYTGKSLVVEEIEGKGRFESPVNGIYFVTWISESQVLALRRKDKTAFVSLLDASGKPLREVALPVMAHAVYPLKGFGRLLLLSSTMETLRIGVRTVARAYVFETSEGTHREAFSIERIHPRSLTGKEFIMGWSGAGPSPLDESLVLIEYKDPPALNPYIKAVAVDYITGRGSVFYRLPMGSLGSGASWSPGGDAVAIPDTEGRLKVIRRTGEAQALDIDVTGRYAAWSPVADRICFGGYILNPDGTGLVMFRNGAKSARCYWRPGGRDVALLDGGRLVFIAGVDEPPADGALGVKASDVIRKVRLLRELLEEGLVDRKEYDMRFQRLTGIGPEVAR